MGSILYVERLGQSSLSFLSFQRSLILAVGVDLCLVIDVSEILFQF